MEKGDALDQIPKDVEDGVLSAEKAAMKVLEIVYTNPGRFNLLDMDEDERSDFLLECLPKLRGMVERYDKSQGPLGAYVFYSMPGLRQTWERRKLEEETGKKGARAGVRGIYELAKERMLTVAEPSDLPEDSDCPKAADVKAPLVFKQIFGRRQNFVESKTVLYKKRAALALALKSAWYIGDSDIQRLSGFCGCESESFAQAMAKVKAFLVEKNERRKDVETRRDKAWYFVCKYRERLLQLNPGSSEWKETKKKLEYQLASWKNKNRLLQGCGLKVAPKNSELAKMLKIRPHRISLFLSYAKKLAESGETLFPSEEAEEE